MMFDEIKKINSTNEKVEFAVNSLTAKEHIFMEVCFNEEVYGISSAGIAKAIGCSNPDKYEDLGAFLEKNDIGGEEVKDYSIINFVEAVKNTSGNEQIKMFGMMLKRFPKEERPWVVRAVQKNMRIGMSLALYNKVRERLGMSLIKPFSVQLCGRVELGGLNKLDYPVVCETKYDGERCLLKVSKGKIMLQSRSGKDITEQFPEVVGQFREMVETDFIWGTVLDGEIVTQSFNDLQKRLGRKVENIESVDSNLKFVVFDVLEYMGRKVEVDGYKGRRILVENLSKKFGFEVSEVKYCDNVEEVKEFFNLMMKNKEEGVVIKNLWGKWVRGDRSNWLKLVPTRTYDVKVVDAYYGNGKNKDYINGLIVADKNGNILGKVSSGIKDNEREVLTKLWDSNELIGKIVEVKFRELTKDGKMRFPVFLRIREDKNEVDEVVQ